LSRGAFLHFRYPVVLLCCRAVVILCGCACVLNFCCLVVLLLFWFQCFVVSLFRCFVVSSFRRFVVLLFCCFVVLLFWCLLVLLCRRVVVCCFVVLLFRCFVVSLVCCFFGLNFVLSIISGHGCVLRGIRCFWSLFGKGVIAIARNVRDVESSNFLRDTKEGTSPSSLDRMKFLLVRMESFVVALC
jgi:hypothetical protein